VKDKSKSAADKHSRSGLAVGVLGAGQLGRMLAQAASRLGVHTVTLDPASNSPISDLQTKQIESAFTTKRSLDQLGFFCDFITLEFENIPADAIEYLEGIVNVRPSSRGVAIAQDRIKEKQCFAESGLYVVAHTPVSSASDSSRAAPNLFPGILKTRRLGYDGKGQKSVANRSQLLAAWRELGEVPCVLEERVDLAAEISVVVARGHDGHAVHLPVQLNQHRDGILWTSQVPARGIPPALQRRAVAATRRLADHLGYVGVLCCEFFITADGRLLANEMAPRPHNSGHHSIDSCDLSQFDLQLRTTLGWPLQQPRRHSAAVMLNLLGDLWFQSAGEARAPNWSELLALPGVHLHLYGKSEARPGRKMGHLTVTAPTLGKAQAVAQKAADMLNLGSLDLEATSAAQTRPPSRPRARSRP
jgi:5-(carboxyamino)imidazole ribonucleotide synthase